MAQFYNTRTTHASISKASFSPPNFLVDPLIRTYRRRTDFYVLSGIDTLSGDVELFIDYYLFSLFTALSSRKHAYIILIPFNPTFI